MKNLLKSFKKYPKSWLTFIGAIAVGLVWVFTESIVLKIFIPVIWYGAIILLHKAGGFNEE